MKKRYLYLVFTSLSILVVLLIAVIFKLSKTTSIHEETPLKVQESEKLQALVQAQNYEDSWVGKISKETNQKTYQYSKEKFYIEFN